MKVVLFCGGRGLRIRPLDDATPKSLMPIGPRPLLWHVMRYYAHFGHTDFVLALGYGARAITDYFHPDVAEAEGWRITFVDTGLDTAIGERLRRVRRFLGDDDMFLANYADVLTDAPLDRIVADAARGEAVGSLLAVRPSHSFHVVEYASGGRVTGLTPAAEMPLRVNGGYFVLRQQIFDYLDEGEDLVGHAFARAAADGRLTAIPYDGFWAPVDTLKERTALEDLVSDGAAPWMVWREDRASWAPSRSARHPADTVRRNGSLRRVAV
jgi:glucose-1-phosphate cytidylyltransferase